MKPPEVLHVFGRRERPALSPVEELLKRLTSRLLRDPYGQDDFHHRLRGDLMWALEAGLTDQAGLSACIDQAETRTDDWFYVGRREEKLTAWQKRREAALAVEREPRAIDMQLDPVYFQAMLSGSKTIEGRAYDPDSDKDYPDIRTGDRVIYGLSTRKPEFAAQLGTMGLRSDLVMTRPVAAVHFSPTVFGLYENTQGCGEELQPMLLGIGNVLARGVVYHGFPGYTERISEHGFVGIEHPVDRIELRLARELASLS